MRKPSNLRGTNVRRLNAATENAAMIGMTAGHNVRRCRHGLGPLTWDEGLVNVAKAHAAKCIYKHSDQTHRVAAYGVSSKTGQEGWVGENIGKTNGPHTPEDLLQMWYDDEIVKYDFDTHSAKSGYTFDDIGHFTQIAWKETTHIGCAVSLCPSLSVPGESSVPNSWFFVCNFWPGGNFDDKLGDHVPPLIANSDTKCKYSHRQAPKDYSGEFTQTGCGSANDVKNSGSYIDIAPYTHEHSADVWCCPNYNCHGYAVKNMYLDAQRHIHVAGICKSCVGHERFWWEFKQCSSDGVCVQTNPGSGVVVVHG